jgi:hypothetical protein
MEYTIEQRNLDSLKISPKFSGYLEFQDVSKTVLDIDSNIKVIGVRHFDEQTLIYLDVRDCKTPLVDLFEDLVEKIDLVLNT